MSKKPTYEELEKKVKSLELNASQHQQIEKALKSSERILSSTLESLDGLLVVIDRDRRVILSNWKDHDFVPEEDRKGHPHCYKIFKHLESPCDYCPPVDTFADGKPRTYEDKNPIDGSFKEISVIPIMDEGGNVANVIEYVQDITKRKQAEELIKTSEEKYRQVIENANEAIFIAQDGIIKFPNPTTEKLTGYSSQELSSIPFTDLIHPDDKNMVINRHKRRLAGEDFPSTYTFKMINKNGNHKWVQISAVAIQWESLPATLNFLRDVTDLKRLEDQLLQAQKMEAVGTLAGGVAHDFNNILMGIQGRISLMAVSENLANDHREHIDEIGEYVQRAADLTRQLLGFARGGKYTIKPLNINELMLNSSSMFGRTKKEIQIHTQLEASTSVVEADQSQIEQVLLNMYVNAWQAMPDGGELYLETKIVHPDDFFCQSHGVEPGRYVKVTIKDTGIGMNSDTQQRIFDPFFTTKEKIRGTGLGLASAYGIIKNHGGMISVSSSVDRGSTFEIYLPASDKKVHREVSLEGQIISGSETILLVDDEVMILNVGQTLLERLGYHVIVSRTPKEAVETISERGHEIDLVILDLIMPGVEGSKIFDRIRKIQPQIPILLSSGYAINDQVETIMQRGCNGFIQKPYNLSELSIEVRKIIDVKNDSVQ